MPDYSKLLAGIKAIVESPAADAASAKMRGALGELWQSLAGTKGYFATGPDATAGGDLAAIGARHGVDIRPSHLEGTLAPEFEASPLSGQGTAYMSSNHTLQQLIEEAQQRGDPMAGIYAGMIKRGQLSPHTQMYGVDSMSLDQGTGGAKNAVPALIDRLMTLPDAANYPATGLSGNNTFKKTIAQAGQLEKYGQRGADRLLLDPSQLTGGTDGIQRLSQYNQMPLEQKQGQLAALSVPGTVNRVNNSIKALQNAHLNGALGTDDLMTELHSLGLQDGWMPSTDVESPYFRRVSDLIRGTSAVTGTPQAVGIDSLRRAAITSDGITRDLQAGDLRGQDFLTTGIARASGGSIPGKTPGALTQTCRCAG